MIIKIITVVILLILILGIILFRSAPKAYSAEGAYVLGHKMKDIDGTEVDLSQYEGRVLMIVNVASKCGLTSQYDDLVTIHKQYRDKGFEILGFPANDFLGQEPGTNKEIKTFCRLNYDVEFKMFSKISVKGKDIAPLYKQLTSKQENGSFGGKIRWNFDKFIIGKNGKVAARFAPTTKPTSEKIIAAIEKELSK